MKPKILLVFEAPKNRHLYANTLPPLGILGMASYLEQNHIPVDILDRNVAKGPKIDLARYDIVGFSINAANISSSLKSIGYVKAQNPGTKVIVGGPSCISNPGYFARLETVDSICVGEGEDALLDYAAEGGFRTGREIPGLYTRTKAGPFVYGGDREYIKDLDRLPFPALDRIRLQDYNVPIRKASPVSTIITSRGCPFSCIFCFHPMGHKWRARSAENVADEIEWQVRELGAKEITIQDDNFSVDINRAKKTFDLLLKRGIDVRLQFQSGLRVDCVDHELLEKMYQAGVWLIGVAPETGSPRVLERIDKKFSLEKVKQVVGWCKGIGIRTWAYYVVGFPFEEAEDIRMTASFLKELDTDFIQLARATPFPLTRLYEMDARDDSKPAFDEELGLFAGIPQLRKSALTEGEMTGWIKKMQRSHYLNPSRMLRLLRILPLASLIRLFFYSLRTGNI